VSPLVKRYPAGSWCLISNVCALYKIYYNKILIVEEHVLSLKEKKQHNIVFSYFQIARKF